MFVAKLSSHYIIRSAVLVLIMALKTSVCLSLEGSQKQGESILLPGPFMAELNPVLSQTSSAGSDTSASSKPTEGNQNNATDMTVHEREYVSPQVRIQMECLRDKTIMKVNFTQPFNGILGAGRLDSTSCKQTGDGKKYYVIQVAHNETNCDTQWDSGTSSIFNTLFIRFHSSLETGNDIAKNIMCQLTVGDIVVGRRPGSKKQKAPKPKSISSTSAEPTDSGSASDGPVELTSASRSFIRR